MLVLGWCVPASGPSVRRCRVPKTGGGRGTVWEADFFVRGPGKGLDNS